MTAKKLPTVEELRKLLRYDPKTGKLFWLPRGNPSFDKQFAGKEALTATNGSGYKIGSVMGQTFRAHRIIWKMATGKEPDQIDHINHKRADNRLINLRASTRGGNAMNQSAKRNNTSGATGVSFHRRTGRWKAAIRHQYIGLFDRKEDAIKARLDAERDLGFHRNHGR